MCKLHLPPKAGKFGQLNRNENLRNEAIYKSYSTIRVYIRWPLCLHFGLFLDIMTSFRVPQSKYRHVFSTASKRENSYEGFRYTKSSCDNPLCAANPKFLAFCIDCGGGGAFQVCYVCFGSHMEDAYFPPDIVK